MIIADDEMRHQMDVEDEFERILARENKKVADEKDLIIAEHVQVITEQVQVIAEKDQALLEKDQALEAERLKVELLMKQLTDFKLKNK